MKYTCQGRVFHGPNYFLPDYAEIGVATVHDLSVFKFPETHPIERIRHFERDFRRSMDRAAHLITDCETIRSEVIDFLGWPSDRITSIPLGVSPDFSPARNEQETASRLESYGLEPGGYALCVSTLEPRKKIDCLLNAYRRLPSSLLKKYPLILVGGIGWRNETLHRDIERAANEGWLRYLGFVAERDLPQIFAGARLFVYPSIYEGFGLPVLEAMASGAPVVTSNRSSLPELARDAALLVEPDNHDSLLECILRGLSDEKWRFTSRIAGLNIAGQYSWDRCIEKTVGVYRRVLSSH